MLTITADMELRILNIKSAYAYGDRLRCLPDAKWSSASKVWQIPFSSLGRLLTDFRGELYFKTPLWEIKGEPAPDVIGDYNIDKRIAIPEMKLQLYPYQQYGAKFMIDRLCTSGFVINADGCGLGKTPQAIACLLWFAKNRNAKKILLSVKKSIKGQWAQEIAKFSSLADEFTIAVTGDTVKRRKDAYKAAREAEKSILITNYHNFLNDTEMIASIKYDIAVIDEAHCVKARNGVMNANISKAIRNTPTVFLTGTPIMSRPGDIFGVISMSNPYYFSKYTPIDEQWPAFKSRYIVTEFSFGREAVIGAKNLDELREKCQSVTIRRTISEVAISMPEITEKNIRIDSDKVQQDMSDLCRDSDTDAKDQYESFSGRSDDYSVEQARKLSNFMKGLICIRQAIATDPMLMKRSASRMVTPFLNLLPGTYKISPKTEAILDTVSEIIDSGEKVILFSKFRTTAIYMADMIKEKLKQEALLYTGAEDQQQRDKAVDLFRNSPEHSVLAGTDAMAEGLNLEQARHVINIDLPDTFAIYAQRAGRVRRVSSKYSNVFIYNFITAGSYDENRFMNIEKNKNLDDALISANKAQSKALAQVSNAS